MLGKTRVTRSDLRIVGDWSSLRVVRLGELAFDCVEVAHGLLEGRIVSELVVVLGLLFHPLLVGGVHVLGLVRQEVVVVHVFLLAVLVGGFRNAAAVLLLQNLSCIFIGRRSTITLGYPL